MNNFELNVFRTNSLITMKFPLITFLIVFTASWTNSQDLNSLKSSLHEHQDDTTRANVLSKIVLLVSDDSKWNYNDTLRQYVEQKLAKTSKKSSNYPTYKKYLAFAINQQGIRLMNFDGNYKESIPFFNRALDIRKELNDLPGMGNIYANLGYAHFGANNLDAAKKNFDLALQTRLKVGDQHQIGLSYYQIGVFYSRQQNIPNGMKYHMKALKIREKLNDIDGLVHSYNDVGSLFYYQGEVDQALKFYKKVLNYENKISDKTVVAGAYGNIALIFNGKNDKKKTLEYLMKSLDLSRKHDYKKIISSSANNIGQFYQSEGNIQEALKYYHESLAMDIALNNTADISISYVNLSNVYYQTKDYPKALEYAKKSLHLAKQSNYPKSIEDALLMHYLIYKAMNKPALALAYYERHVEQKELIHSKENQQAISDMKYRYEYEKKAAADSIQSAGERQVLDAKLKQEKTQRYALYGGISLVGLFGLFMFNRFRVTSRQKKIIEEQEKATKKQNELISFQKQEVEYQKVMVEEKQKEIIDSIAYAKRLQDAILPSAEFIDKYIPENFILYKPKDIVAGDFYWAEHMDELFFIAAADSTGHGVPGAMVSVVCSNALNRSVKEFGLRIPGDILNKTRELVVETFAKNNSEVKDGMDISLLCYDKKNNQVLWSGANNPLWYIENNEWKEIKADKQPIGKSDHAKEFTTHQIQLSHSVMFYLFTDGFADQFGGEKGKKYKYNNFKDLLFQVHQKDLAHQQHLIDSNFNQWKGELEQVDDVCVLGLKINVLEKLNQARVRNSYLI